MITPGIATFAVNRGTPGKLEIEFAGYDFTGATFRATVKDGPDALGDPLIVLETATSPAEGISVTVADEDVVDDDGNVTGAIKVSTVQIRINETTIEGVYAPGSGVKAIGSDVKLFWGLHITTTGLGKVRWLDGPFIIRAGDQG